MSLGKTLGDFYEAGNGGEENYSTDLREGVSMDKVNGDEAC